MIAFRTSRRSVFLYGFVKNEKENINEVELNDLKKLAGRLLAYDDRELKQALTAKELIEVPYDDED